MANTPPASGYKPLYVNRAVTMDSMNTNQVSASIVRTEINSNKVRIYVNIVDKAGRLYIGGTGKTHDKIWCNLVEYSLNDSNAFDISDFKITEQTEFNVSPLALVFVLDHSGSMGESRAFKVQDAIIKLVRKKRDIDAIAIIKYDGKVNVDVPLTKDLNKILTNFKRNGLTGYGGFTAINNAVSVAIDLLKNKPEYSNKQIMVFTDGLDNSSTISKQEVINKAKEFNIPVSAVDFGGSVDQKYMLSIADETGGAYYHIYNAIEFENMFKDGYIRMLNNYIIEFTPHGFGLRKTELKLCLKDTTLVLKHDFYYQPKKGQVINLAIHFDTGKFNIEQTYDGELKAVVRMFGEYPKMTVEIAGHTDDVGEDDMNQLLSENRAAAVKNFFIKNGVSEKRMTTIGYGKKAYIADNSSDTGRRTNRRTEIKIVTLNSK